MGVQRTTGLCRGTLGGSPKHKTPLSEGWGGAPTEREWGEAVTRPPKTEDIPAGRGDCGSGVGVLQYVVAARAPRGHGVAAPPSAAVLACLRSGLRVRHVGNERAEAGGDKDMLPGSDTN